MRYRTKLLVTMVLLTASSNAVLLTLSYLGARRAIVGEMQSKVLSLASTAALLIDADEHAAAVASGDQNGPAYLSVERTLRTVRDANRRADMEVRFIYTLIEDPGAPAGVAIGVDAEEAESGQKSPIGEPVEPLGRRRTGRVRIDVPVAEGIVEDKYGRFLSGSAPIRDSSGKAVAAVGVDLAAKDVEARLDALLVNGLTAMGAATLVAAGLGAWLSRRVTRALDSLGAAMKRMSESDYSEPARIGSGDEFGELARRFNQLMPRLQQQLKMSRDLGLAMEVQQNLLPRRTPDLPGFDIAGRSLYCDQTGGDYFDFVDLPSPDGRQLGVLVGDVTGHGVAAALLMTTARAVLRAHAVLSDDIAEHVRELNRHLVHDATDGRFMTLYYLVIDPVRRRVRWVGAGHDPAIVYDPADGTFRDLKGSDIPLGIEHDWAFNEHSHEDCLHERVLFLVTDGVSEARNSRGEMFGRERLNAVIRKSANKSAKDILDAITEAITAFRGSRAQEDDITLVVVKMVEEVG